MRMSNRFFGFVAGFGALVWAAVSPALDGAPQPHRVSPSNIIPGGLGAGSTKTFGAEDPLKAGMRAYMAGNKAGAARQLFFAAEQGDLLAQWKLGRMHAEGDGVAEDHLKAFEMFSKIIETHADEPSDGAKARVVAQAFVAVGTYWMDGIAGTDVKPNAEKAHKAFHYAASYFGDGDAQYQLGRMHLDGLLGIRNPKQAGRWFNLAANSGHSRAQAMLGHLLWTGDGLQRQPAQGLMWVTLAKRATPADKDPWVHELYAAIVSQATEEQRGLSAMMAERHARKDN
jgi:hypothetical protein